MTKPDFKTFVLRNIVRISLFCLILNPFAVQGNAKAYNLGGARWPNQPTSGCCAHISAYYISATMLAKDYQGWNDGVGVWGTSGSNLKFDHNTSGGQIHIYDQNSDQNVDGTSGWDDVNFTNAYAWLNTRTTPNFSQNKVQALATHELGHLSNLAHQSDICSSSTPTIMFYAAGPQFDSCGINTPQPDDVTGVNAQY